MAFIEGCVAFILTSGVAFIEGCPDVRGGKGSTVILGVYCSSYSSR